MKLLVFGAGGAIGQRIVAEALTRGHDVTAVHRRAPAAGAPVRFVTGDIRDAPAVLRRAPGQDAVISAVGAGPTSPNPDYRVYPDAARALIGALRALPGPAIRLLVVGGAGSLLTGSGRRLVDAPGFPGAFRDDALAQAEALDLYRAASDIPWTYLSPAAMIAPGERTGSFRIGGDELLVDDDGHSRVTIEDFAVAALDQLEVPDAIGRRITVAY